METHLVVKINKEISILVDKYQYIVKLSYGSKPEYWYFGSLDFCFQEIFEYICINRLKKNEKKDLKNVAGIISKTKKEIIKIMKPFVDLKTMSTTRIN
jgi:hypothetical protein